MEINIIVREWEGEIQKQCYLCKKMVDENLTTRTQDNKVICDACKDTN